MFKSLVCILVSSFFSLMASDNCSQDEGSYDLVIKELHYQKNLEPNGGKSGTLSCSRFDYSSKSFQFGLDNTDEIFDSTIIMRPDYVGLSGPNIRVGGAQTERSFLHKIAEMKVFNSHFMLNPHALNLLGNSLFMKIGESFFDFSSFNLKCIRENSRDKIGEDCLNQGYVSSLVNDIPFRMKFSTMLKDSKTDLLSSFKISGSLNQLRLTEDQVNVVGANLSFLLNDQIAILLDRPQISCRKSKVENANVKVLEDLNDTCTNELKAKFKKVTIDRGVEKVYTELFPNTFIIENERFSTQLTAAKFTKSKDYTYLYDVRLSCKKKRATPLLNLTAMIGDCMESGTLSLNSIVSVKDEQIQSRERREELREMREFMRDRAISVSASSKKQNIELDTPSRNLQLSFVRKVWTAKMDVEFLSTYFTIRITGKGRIDQTQKLIFIDIDSASWRGIPIKTVALYFLKKYFLGAQVYEVDSDSIAIRM